MLPDWIPFVALGWFAAVVWYARWQRRKYINNVTIPVRIMNERLNK